VLIERERRGWRTALVDLGGTGAGLRDEYGIYAGEERESVSMDGNGERADSGPTVGTMSREEAESWSDRLAKTGFWESNVHSTGNMTTSIEMDRAESGMSCSGPARPPMRRRSPGGSRHS